MKYIHTKAFEIPLYRGYLLIIISNDEGEIREYLPDFGEDPYATTCFTEYKGREAFAIVLNFDHSFGEINNGTIAHESHHAANMIAHIRGFEPDFINDEPMAYLNEWICSQVHRFAHEEGFEIAL